MSDPRDERVWRPGWDAQHDAQARRLAALSLAEKLDWLEEAHARVLHMSGASVVREAAEGERGPKGPGGSD